MKRTTIFFCLLSLLGHQIKAQFETQPQLFVFGIAGDVSTNEEGHQMSWTLGEAIALDAFETSTERAMLVGYQQGVNQTVITVPVVDFEDPIYHIKLFPNPASDVIYIDFGDFPMDNAWMSLSDNQGSLIAYIEAKAFIDLRTYAPGTYFLTIGHDKFRITRPFIIVK